jgi:hypothetical protein
MTPNPALPKGFRGIDTIDPNQPQTQRWISRQENTTGTRNIITFTVSDFIWFRVVSFINALNTDTVVKAGLGVCAFEGEFDAAALTVMSALGRFGPCRHNIEYGWFDAAVDEININADVGVQSILASNQDLYVATPFLFGESVRGADHWCRNVPLPVSKVFFGPHTFQVGATWNYVPGNGLIINNRLNFCVQGVSISQG